jgi:hypothetical protein
MVTMRLLALVLCASMCASLLQQALARGKSEQEREQEEPESPEDRFYIHDWPSLRGINSWPLSRANLEKTGKASILYFRREHSANYGAGQELNASIGMYSTNPYHLYQLIMSRLRLHPLRVLDKKKANLFIIPYDIGVVSQWDPLTGVYKMHQVGGCPNSDTVSSLLRTAVAESPLNGHDHVLINSMFGLLNFNCYKIMTNCLNCARLTSEPSRARFPLDTSSSTAFYKYIAKRNLSVPHGTLGVPIPASIHYNEGMKEYPWSNWEAEREILVTGWFALNVQNPMAKRLRSDLFNQCRARSDKCALISILERSGHQAKTVSLKKTSYSTVTSTAGSNLTSTFETGYDYYRHSTFCLQPPGDMEMRKGVFDSILLGCSPVLVLPNILSKKYPWYFSRKVEKLVSVNVAHVSNVVTYLESIPNDVVHKMRRAMAELAPSLSYSLPPTTRFRKGAEDKQGIVDGAASWQPPFRDAVDVMLRSLFQRVRRYKVTREVPKHETLINATDRIVYWNFGHKAHPLKKWAREGEM